MFGFSLSHRIYLYSHPTDMRKSFDGLAGIISSELKLNALRDGAFVFVNKRKDRMKVLVWDRHGFWLFYKRLEAGQFQVPPVETDMTPEGLTVSYEQLMMIIEGIDLTSVKRKKRYKNAINT
jgi:transposase